VALDLDQKEGAYFIDPPVSSYTHPLKIDMETFNYKEYLSSISNSLL